MKKVLLIFIGLILYSCTNNVGNLTTLSDKEAEEVNPHQMAIEYGDSCEYWPFDNGNGGIPIHKGNCRYCAENAKKQLEYLAKQIAYNIQELQNKQHGISNKK